MLKFQRLVIVGLKISDGKKEDARNIHADGTVLQTNARSITDPKVILLESIVFDKLYKFLLRKRGGIIVALNEVAAHFFKLM